MPKPSEANAFIKDALNVWNTGDHTFALLVTVTKHGEEYKVKVFPHDDRESFWLDGTFETESGAAWMILNYLDRGW